MQPQTIQDIQNYFNEHDLFNKYGLTKIGVFGSFARGEKFNDIDLYIEDEIELRKLVELKLIIELDWNTRIDLVQKKYEDPLIMYYAKQHLIYLYAA